MISFTNEYTLSSSNEASSFQQSPDDEEEQDIKKIKLEHQPEPDLFVYPMNKISSSETNSIILFIDVVGNGIVINYY